MSTQIFDRNELLDYVQGLGNTDITDHGWEWAESLFYEGLDYRQITSKLLCHDLVIE